MAIQAIHYDECGRETSRCDEALDESRCVPHVFTCRQVTREEVHLQNKGTQRRLSHAARFAALFTDDEVR